VFATAGSQRTRGLLIPHCEVCFCPNDLGKCASLCFLTISEQFLTTKTNQLIMRTPMPQKLCVATAGSQRTRGLLIPLDEVCFCPNNLGKCASVCFFTTAEKFFTPKQSINHSRTNAAKAVCLLLQVPSGHVAC
jgi:hypothetical protein